VFEQPETSTPFATLLHFRKPSVSDQPRVLVVGPMSGHFTTLIRPTIRTLLSDHDVYVLDWHNARDIPATEGPFGLDEYIEHVMEALRHLGAGTHVVAVCQPAVPVLAAVALLAAEGDVAQPSSLTLMAGPVDTRVNPNRINTMAATKPLSSFERRVIDTVPARYAGAGRRVYPGVVQLTAFMSMNPKRHLQAHARLYRDLVVGDMDGAARTRAFYDEYGAVMDVPAEFYLETVGRIFQENLMATGQFTWRGEPVDPAVITGTALLTIEGANDDICSPGQTEAAHALCTGIPDDRKQHHLQPGVGHYGVFSGSRWEAEVYPVLRDFIAEARSRESLVSPA
jgi:polyhydroxyalkanoate depolymerase